MKKMKWMFTAACMVLALAGCSAKTAETEAPKEETSAKTSVDQTTESTKSSQGDQITLRFAWWGGDDRHTATLKAIYHYYIYSIYFFNQCEMDVLWR